AQLPGKASHERRFRTWCRLDARRNAVLLPGKAREIINGHFEETGSAFKSDRVGKASQARELDRHTNTAGRAKVEFRIRFYAAAPIVVVLERCQLAQEGGSEIEVV